MRVVVFRLFRLAVWESLDGGGWLLKDCKTRISNLDQVAEGFRMLICRCLGDGHSSLGLFLRGIPLVLKTLLHSRCKCQGS